MPYFRDLMVKTSYYGDMNSCSKYKILSYFDDGNPFTCKDGLYVESGTIVSLSAGNNQYVLGCHAKWNCWAAAYLLPVTATSHGLCTLTTTDNASNSLKTGQNCYYFLISKGILWLKFIEISLLCVPEIVTNGNLAMFWSISCSFMVISSRIFTWFSDDYWVQDVQEGWNGCFSK